MREWRRGRSLPLPTDGRRGFDDVAADGQSHSCSVWLGGVEGIKNPAHLLRQSDASITDGNQQLIVTIVLRGKREFAFALYGLHGIDAVYHQVHQHLLELDAISHDLRKICGELALDGYVVPGRFVAEQRDNLGDDSIDIDQLAVGRAFLEQQPDAADDLSCPLRVFDDSSGCRARLLDVGIIARKPAHTCVSVRHGGSNRLVDLMGKRRSQLAHRGHSVHVRELCLQLAQLVTLFLGAPAVRHIYSSADVFSDLSICIENWMADRMDVLDSSIGQHDPVLMVVLHVSD